MLLPLTGFTIGVTADRRADEQSELLRRRGAEVVHGPVIRTLPLTDGPELQRATEAIVADPPDTLVALTAVGIRSWFEAADGRGLGDALRDRLAATTVLARGPKSHGALATVGLTASWTAPGETAAEVLAHLGPHLAGRRIAVQRDGDDVAHAADELRSRGADVIDVPVYRWSLPEDPTPAESLIGAIVGARIDAVTFTSAAASTNLFELAARAGGADLRRSLAAALRGPVTPVCVGPVSAARLHAHGVPGALHPGRWRLGPMIRTLTDALTARRRATTLAGIATEVQGTAVAVGDDLLSLSRREGQLLTALLDAGGAVVAKERLADDVWEPGTDPHVVEVTVARLRQRLGPAGKALETVPRRGYRIGS